MPQAKKGGSGGAKSKRASSRAKGSSNKRAASSGNGDSNPVVELLQRGIEAPLSLVMLTNERIQEVMDDAVERGRMTRADAEEMTATLLKRGRRTTEDFIADAQQVVGSATNAARRSKPADRMLRGVDRARRATGVGAAFPIMSYDDLTAAQVSDRLVDLSPAELRKVRDYERRHGNRKSVLAAIESKRLMRYREHAPPAALAPWVDCAWEIGPGEPVEDHRVLPDGCIDVLWSSTLGVNVVGPMTRAIVAPLGAGSRVAGIRFRPGAAPALLGVPADALLDARVAPSELLGDDGARLEEDLAGSAPLDALRRWVARRAVRSPRPDPLVDAAVARIAAGRPTGDLGVSTRHLRRRMTAEVGYGPKRLARVLRLRRALDAAPAEGLASAALDAGYADQSHFTNDCVELAGLPPGRLLAAA